MSTAEILVTGRAFSRRGLRAVEPTTEAMIMSAQQQIHLAAYLITESACSIVDLLEMALARGVAVSIIVNKLDVQVAPVVDRLRDLARRFSHMRLLSFNDPAGTQLHAKVLVADRRRALIGSANYSWGGLVANHELAVLVEGGAAECVANLLEDLMSRFGQPPDG